MASAAGRHRLGFDTDTKAVTIDAGSAITLANVALVRLQASGVAFVSVPAVSLDRGMGR